MKELKDFGYIIWLIHSQREKLPGAVNQFRVDHAEHKELQKLLGALFAIYSDRVDGYISGKVDREPFSCERGLGVGMPRDDRAAHQVAQHGVDLGDDLAETTAAKRAKKRLETEERLYKLFRPASRGLADTVIKPDERDMIGDIFDELREFRVAKLNQQGAWEDETTPPDS